MEPTSDREHRLAVAGLSFLLHSAAVGACDLAPPQWTLVGEATVGLARAIGAPVIASLVVGFAHRNWWCALAGTAAGVAGIWFVAFWEALRGGPYVYEPSVLAEPFTYWVGLSLAYVPLLGLCQLVPRRVSRSLRGERARTFDWVRTTSEPRRFRVVCTVAVVHAVLAAGLMSSVTAILPGVAFTWTTPLIPIAVAVLAALPVAGEGPQGTFLGSPRSFVGYTTTTSVSAALMGFFSTPTLWFASEHGLTARQVVAWVDGLDYTGPALGGIWLLAVALTTPVAWLAAAVSRRIVLAWTDRGLSDS